MTEVMIGVDPHKRSHTATMLDRAERELRTDHGAGCGRRQVAELLEWADGARPRTWAVESAGGMGYLLSQQLVAAGETVLDVPATLASRVRVLGTGQSAKSDPNDARSVAVAALRAPSLARCARLTTSRCAGCCRSVTATLPAGGTGCAVGCTRWSPSWCPVGIDKEVVVNQARSLLDEYRARRCGGDRAAPSSGRARRRDRRPRRRPQRLESTDHRRR